MYVALRPRTPEANAILEQFGDIWQVQSTYKEPVYGSQKKLRLDCRSDFRSKSMWVSEPDDELFEVIYL